MFTEIFTEARPDLVVNTTPNYVFVIREPYLDGSCLTVEYYYLIPLSSISSDELAVLEYEGYFDSDYLDELNRVLSRFEEFKTDALVIKANIVAVYRK